jgi:anaerobic carbon-monoxide dehydrogenase iron sulfur subunit
MKRLVKDENLCIECHRCEEIMCTGILQIRGTSARLDCNVARRKTGEVDITICTQCGKCMEVCQVLAITRNPKTGVVQVRQESMRRLLYVCGRLSHLMP